MDIGIPLWPGRPLVPIALSVRSVRLLLQLWGYARALHSGTGRPVAVPLIEDAAS